MESPNWTGIMHIQSVLIPLVHYSNHLLSYNVPISIVLTVCVPEEAQVGETLYIFDDLLKRNIVTCVIRPKINIKQNFS